MAVTKNTNGNYTILTGTASEVLQALSDEGIMKHQIVEVASDGTSAVYRKGNA